MRSFRTLLIAAAYETALLILALVLLKPFTGGKIFLNTMQRGPMCYAVLLGAQFLLIILIAPAMTSGSIAGERERQTLDLLLVTNTRSFRIITGKIMESFVLLALMIICGLPVMCLCLMTGGVNIGRILLGELFLLAEALACVSVGVFCSSICRSTVVSGVMSYVILLGIGAVTALPFLLGYPVKVTNVVYDQMKYATLTPAEARSMISPLLRLNPGFGLVCLIQGQTQALTGRLTGNGWGRLYCTWLLMDRGGCETIAAINAGLMVLMSALLAGISALFVRSGRKRKQ